VVLVAFHAGDTGGQGQAEEGLSAKPPKGVCTASNCGNKHPKVCLVADHSKGKIPKATCSLWHMLVPFAGNAGNVTGRRNGFNHPPGSKGSKAKVAVRPVKPDAKLAKLTATTLAEELKAMIRTAKMMDDARRLIQPDGAGPRTGPCHAGTGPGPGPGTGLDPSRAAHLPGCSNPGQGSEDSVGCH
jgi:hypothetical protein